MYTSLTKLNEELVFGAKLTLKTEQLNAQVVGKSAEHC